MIISFELVGFMSCFSVAGCVVVCMADLLGNAIFYMACVLDLSCA